MPKEPLELKPANDPKQIAAIVKETIQSIYPKYYPAGAVRFFRKRFDGYKMKLPLHDFSIGERFS